MHLRPAPQISSGQENSNNGGRGIWSIFQSRRYVPSSKLWSHGCYKGLASLDYHQKIDQLNVGDVFSSLEAFKKAVTNLAIYQRWKFQVGGSNQSHIRLKCLHASPSGTCKWRARCSYSSFFGARITAWEGEHTCFDSLREKRPLVAR